jgi:hypothetical protein
MPLLSALVTGKKRVEAERKKGSRRGKEEENSVS